MTALYIHIPYCYRACSYCNFHFSTQFSTKEKMIAAICSELEIKGGQEISSLYFGGGTPSVLSIEEIERIFQTLHQNFTWTDDIEITLEANPEDLKDEKLSVWKRLGVNRLSIGLQSFQDSILKQINRQHTKEIAIEGILRSKQYFDNFSLDLICGLPGLNQDKLQEDIESLLSLAPKHVSVYLLGLEEKTKLHHQVLKGEIVLPNEEEARDQYLLTHRLLSKAGYDHYEISNFSLKGAKAKHNSSYWEGVTYVGIGPGAHSFDGKKRQWNLENNPLYIKALEEQKAFFEEETLSKEDHFNERVMISLRTYDGLDLGKIKKDFPSLIDSSFDQHINKWLDKGLAIRHGEHISLTPESWLLSDMLASDLFIL